MKTLQEDFNALAGILTMVMSSIVAVNESNGASPQTMILNRAPSKGNFLSVLLIGLYMVAAFRSLAQIPCDNPTTSYTIDFPAGWTMFANQLDNGGDPANNTLSILLATVPPGPQNKVLKWNVSSQSFFTSVKTPGGWSTNMTLNPGEGAFLKLSAPLSVMFTGTPRSTEPPLAIDPGFNLVSRQKPCRGTYEDIVGSAPVAGTRVYQWKGPLCTCDPDPDCLECYNIYTCNGSAWDPIPPTIGVGEAVFVRTAGGSAPSTIEGTAYRDSGDCTVPGDGVLPNWHIVLNPAGNTRHTFTDQNGHYKFNAGSGTYTVSQVPDNCFTPTCPTSPGTYTFTVNPGDVITEKDFGSSIVIGTKPDLFVQVYATYPSHPVDGRRGNSPCCGSTMDYHIFYRNQCLAAPAGATVVLNLSGPVSFAAANPSPTSGGSLGSQNMTWTLGALSAGAIGQIDVTVNLDPLGSTCSHSAATLVAATVTINPVTGGADYNYANNIAKHTTYTECSFDPNDKAVTPKGCGPAGLISGNQLLTYVVQFQNLGSGPAFDVVVRDRLDDDVDLSTLEVIGASHNHVFALNGREMVWTFPNIYLPAAVDNEPGSHGFFSYRVKPLPGLAEGTVITNRADIYFDNNPPVLTPITTNTITLNTAPLPVASFTVTPQQGSAGHTNDFTYTGGTAGATFLWSFGSGTVPATSTDMNPSGVVFATNGLRNVSLQVSLAGCDAEPATYLLSVGQPKLNVGLSDNQVCLSWEGDGYSLQETGTLETPIPWQTIYPLIAQLGSTHLVCLGVTNTVRCYRLTDQP